MEEYETVKGHDRLISVFGCWPSFHDAEVIWLRLNRGSTSLGNGPTLEVLVHVFQATNEVNSERFYVLRNHVLVHLRFSGAVESSIDGFNCQNVLLGLDIVNIRSRQIRQVNLEVVFNSAYGVSATFQCQAVEVVDVMPCDSKATPLCSP
ncbi:MAG: immunity 50 family protein [Planctomycetaceae bacterium]|nr:immunity 50 family protein [Planctomycetaceae bacterium]